MAAKRFKDLSERARADHERAIAIGELVAHTLAGLRRARQVTQHELARAMATSQPYVSRIERAGVVELTTLRRYVEALGGRLEVTAVFDDEWLPLAVGDDQRQEGPTLARKRTGLGSAAFSVVRRRSP